MAELLYHLGKFAARRAWLVVSTWVALLAIAGLGFAAGFGGLTTSFDIPGTASGAVIDELQEQLPDFSGASGTVVFESTDGSRLSDEQRAGISALVAGGADLPDVADIIDPFETEQQRADRTQQLVDGQTELDSARAQLDAGQAGLDAAGQQLPAEQLAAQQAQLD